MTKLPLNPAADPAVDSSPLLLICPECSRSVTEDYNSFWCDWCKRLWPKGSGHEQYVREVPCPDCYGGHFRPCNICGDSGVALLRVDASQQLPLHPQSTTNQGARQ